MPRLAALYRALNVGRRRIAMDRLRAVHEAVGSADVQTFLASGNVVFSTRARNRPALARRLEAEFAREVGFTSDVILRDGLELRSAVARNPFVGKGHAPKLVHTVFLREPPEGEAVAAWLDDHAGPEEVFVDGSEAFVYYPAGVARSDLDLKPLGPARTSRNANTVAKLLDLLER